MSLRRIYTGRLKWISVTLWWWRSCARHQLTMTCPPSNNGWSWWDDPLVRPREKYNFPPLVWRLSLHTDWGYRLQSDALPALRRALSGWESVMRPWKCNRRPADRRKGCRTYSKDLEAKKKFCWSFLFPPPPRFKKRALEDICAQVGYRTRHRLPS
jgi:hypothetical protein